MSTEENKANSRRFYEEVINGKDLAVLNELIADNFVAHDFPPDLPSGPAGLKVVVSAFHAGFPDGYLTIDQMIAEGDTVAVRLTFRGTHTGEFQGIAPTGKTVTVPVLDMVHVVDGKAVELWGGPNQFILLQQLGVIPS